MTKIASISLKDFENIGSMYLGDRADIFYDIFEYHLRNGHCNYRIISKNGAEAVPTVIDPNTFEEKKMISFVSNDYLGFSKHPKIIDAGIEALKTYGTGAGSSPLIGGISSIHHQLERKIAAFFHKEDAISFTAGYAANSGTLSVLLQKEDLAILDMGVHASVLEGCAQANKKFFLHNDMSSLQRVLEQTQGLYKNTFIVVDGVYSQDGDIVHLHRVCELAKEYNAFLVVDDAHGVGVVGEYGKGVFELFDIYDQIDLITGTFSKSFASVGGYAAGSKKIITLLKFLSPQNIFSAAATPQSVASVIKAMELLDEEPVWHKKLEENIAYFKEGLEILGIDYGNSASAIFPIMIRNEEKTMLAGKILLENNIYANPILYPAVSRKQTRIRMSLIATHTTEMLDETLNILDYTLKKITL